MKDKLKRELGLFDVTVAGVAVIIGAGVYALIGVASGTAGNAVWLSFLISAIIAMFTGLSYAELSSMFKGDAGEFDYIKMPFGKMFAFFIAFTIILGTVISSAAVALGFGGYFSKLFGVPVLSSALVLMMLMTLLNYSGIKQTSIFNKLSTTLEFIGLIIIIVAGFFFSKPTNYFEMPFGFSGVMSSAALVFFAYLGFEGIVKLRDETKNPERNIPLGMILALIISSVLYVLVSYSAVGVLGWQQLSSTQAPLAQVASLAFGNLGFLFLAVIALFSTSNTVLMTMVAASRQLYGMAEEHSLPKFLSKVDKKTGTPLFAILLTGVVALVFGLMGDIEFVANLTNLFLFITFVAVNMSLIVLRYTKADMRRPFRCPVNIGKFNVVALFGVLSSLGMIWIVLTNLF